MLDDTDKDRVALGIKQLSEDPNEGNDLEEFKKNMVVTCVVSEVKDDGIEVDIDGKAVGTIKKADLSAEKYDQKGLSVTLLQNFLVAYWTNNLFVKLSFYVLLIKGCRFQLIN